MDALGLPARIAYAVAAIPLAGAAGFYSSIWLLPKLTALLQRPETGWDGFEIFQVAASVGGASAFTASLVALTLPSLRRRKRRGRTGRMILSGVFVLLFSIGFAGQGYGLVYDLAVAAWLAYTTAFTFVRYGVLDQQKRTSSSARTSSPAHRAA